MQETRGLMGVRKSRYEDRREIAREKKIEEESEKEREREKGTK